MRNKNIMKVVMCALFAAITCVFTLFIKVPVPIAGYINLGDCIVLLGAFVLGAGYGGAAAGIGSALGDLVGGYAMYIPGTFIIKLIMGLAAGCIFNAMKKKSKTLAAALGGVVAEAIMVLGYFIYEAFFMGYGFAASANILYNLVQGAAGIVVSVVLYTALDKGKALKKIG